MKTIAPLLFLCLVTSYLNIYSQGLNFIKQISGTGNDYIRASTNDGSGNIYVVGSFDGVIDFDPGPGTSNSGSAVGTDIWFGKYTSSGSLVWGKALIGGSDDFGLDIALDASGNIYIVGYFGGTLDFDPGAGNNSYTASGPSDILLAKYDNNGNYSWGKKIGASTVSSTGRGLAIDNSNNVYITGQISSTSPATVYFDPPSSGSTSTSNGSIFFAKYSSTGAYNWVKNFGASSSSGAAEDISLDGSSNIYLTGYFYGSTDFNPGGSGTIYNSNNGSTFIAKYNNSGVYQWGYQGGLGIGYEGIEVVANPAGNAYLVGDGNQNIVISKYSSGGLAWQQIIGGSSFDYGQSIALDGAGNFYVSGITTGTGSLQIFDQLGATGAGLNLPNGITDFFIAKYAEANGHLIYVRNLNYVLNLTDYAANSIKISNGKTILAGNFKGTGNFNPCGGSTTYSASTVDGFIAGYNLVDQPMLVSGPPVVCSSGGPFVFSVINAPLGATITWSTNPSTLLNPSSGTGSTFSTSAKVKVSGFVTVTATISGTCSGSVQKVIQVGKPPAPTGIQTAWQDFPPYAVCPGYDYNFFMTDPTYYFGYEPDREWYVTGGTIENYYYNNTAVGVHISSVFYNGDIGVRNCNECGCSAYYSGAFVEDCEGGEYLMIASPNPTTCVISIKINDNNGIKRSGSAHAVINDEKGITRRDLRMPSIDESIDVCDLQRGTYYLTVFFEGKIFKQRVLIE